MESSIRKIQNNPSLTGLARFYKDVKFASPEGVDLYMQIMAPWLTENDERTYPLIVFIQGSAWTFPDVNYEIPQLARYAQAGYVMATVTHRNCMENHPWPAFLQDVKTAIRFLRAHAEEYHIDPYRVCSFGTSSGGNTSLLLGLTGEDTSLETADYAEFSSKVQLVVECFGPTDLIAMIQPHYKPELDQSDSLFYQLAGGPVNESWDVLKAMSPMYRVEAGKDYPPFLLIHGDADTVVPYSQSTDLYAKLLELGYNASMICIPDAPHEGNFWSQELHDAILAFIREKL
jgi:acetyl esterase/lipase